MKLEICAELSCNHLGSLYRALDIVDAAYYAGADLFKVQVWTPDTMCVDKIYVLEGGPWHGRLLHELYEEAHTPWNWLPVIFDHVRAKGMIPFGAAFDEASVDYLEKLGVDRHKVASFEITDLPLIRYMAKQGRPMIISTGMATIDDILAASYACGSNTTTMLKCTSAYPAKPQDANLATMAEWVKPYGLSDHSLGHGVAVAAVALGACYVEKHLTLNRADGGPDAGFSMEPEEFRQMVIACREAEAAIGVPHYGPGGGESTTLRRSLYTITDIDQGDPLILGNNIATARPALGLPPGTDLRYAYAACNIPAMQPLLKEHIA